MECSKIVHTASVLILLLPPPPSHGCCRQPFSYLFVSLLFLLWALFGGSKGKKSAVAIATVHLPTYLYSHPLDALRLWRWLQQGGGKTEATTIPWCPERRRDPQWLLLLLLFTAATLGQEWVRKELAMMQRRCYCCMCEIACSNFRWLWEPMALLPECQSVGMHGFLIRTSLMPAVAFCLPN